MSGPIGVKLGIASVGAGAVWSREGTFMVARVPLWFPESDPIPTEHDPAFFLNLTPVGH